MKKVKIKFLLISFIIALFGCAGDFAYKPPEKTSGSIENTVQIKSPKNEVWKTITLALDDSSFVIDDFDKNAGFIYLSYSGDPEKYIDCGIIESYVKDAWGQRRYKFPASASYEEYETMVGTQKVLYHERKMNLEARVNVALQETSKNSTLITVNTKYILIKDIVTTDSYGKQNLTNDEISFNTKNSGTYQDDGLVCSATGALEREVVSSLGV